MFIFRQFKLIWGNCIFYISEFDSTKGVDNFLVFYSVDGIESDTAIQLTLAESMGWIIDYINNNMVGVIYDLYFQLSYYCGGCGHTQKDEFVKCSDCDK